MKIQLIDESQKSKQNPKGLRVGILTLGGDGYMIFEKAGACEKKCSHIILSRGFIEMLPHPTGSQPQKIPYTTTAMIHPTLTYSDGTEIREGDTGTCSRMWGDCIIILVEERWTLKFDSGQMPDMDYSWSQMLTRTGSIYESGSE